MNQNRNIAIGLIAIGLLASLLYVLDNSALGKKSDNVKEAENDRNEDRSVDIKHDTITSEKQNADGSTTVEITKVKANSPDDNNPIIDNEKAVVKQSSDSNHKSSSSKSSKSDSNPESKYMIIFQDGQYAVFLILDVDNEVITKMRPVAQFEHSSDAKKFIEIMESVS